MPIGARHRPAPRTTTTTATTTITRIVTGRRQYHLFSGLSSVLARRRMASASASAPATRRDAPVERGALAPSLANQDEWSEYHSRWEKIWTEGCAPGQCFDKASASPMLRSLLSLPLLPEQAAHLSSTAAAPLPPPSPPPLDVRGKRALVPGCGRGYDVAAFAQAGAAAAVGLELSATAAAAAREFVSRELSSSSSRGNGAGAQARTSIVQCDFFAPPEDTVPPSSFDFGYDLTFLCALHPDMREAWAAGWARLLKPGAKLITACYPIDAARDQNSGPPWPLTPQLYERLLLNNDGGAAGGGGGGAKFKKVYLEPVPPGMSHPSRAGHEWLGIWERV